MTTPNTDPNAAVVAPVLDASVIATAVQAGLQAHQASVESAPKAMTDEQRSEYLQIFDPNADGFVDSFVSAITDAEATPETRLKVLSHFRDGVANQSIRGAQILVAQEVAKLRQEFAPVLATSQEAQSEKVWASFQAKFPDLKDRRDLVDAVSTQLQQQGFKPTNLDEAFTRAATTARSIISGVTGVAAPVANQTVPNTMPRMTPTNTQSAGAGTPQGNNSPGVAPFFLNRRR